MRSRLTVRQRASRDGDPVNRTLPAAATKTARRDTRPTPACGPHPRCATPAPNLGPCRMGGARPLLPQELPFQLLAFANWARAFRDGDRVNRTRRHRPRNLSAWARPRARGWPSRLAPRHARAKPVARSPGPAGAPSRCSGSVRPRHPPWDRTRRSDIRSRIQNPCGRCLGVEASGASSECTELQGR